jgi:hypothetical protein
LYGAERTKCLTPISPIQDRLDLSIGYPNGFESVGVGVMHSFWLRDLEWWDG